MSDSFLDMRKLITAGAQHDMGFPGVRFDYGHITVKAYPVGTMVIYGAKTRDAMWTSLSRLLDMLELECRREDLHVFLVVARANLKINIKEIKDIVIKSLSKSYNVWYESEMEIPGIMLKKGKHHVKHHGQGVHERHDDLRGRIRKGRGIGNN